MKKKTKIAILIDRLNVGGVEKTAIEEVRALRNLGEDAYLVVLRRKGVVNNAFLDLRINLPTIYLDDRLPSFLKFSFKFPIFHFFSFFHLSYPFLIPMVIKKKEFDYLIVHGTYTAFTAVGIKKVKKINYSVFIWDPINYILTRVYSKNLTLFLQVFLKIARFLDKMIIDNADIILVGGGAHDKFIKKINSKKKIIVIPPSITPIKNLYKNKKNYVLMVTAWKKGKNPEYIQDIVKKVPKIKINMVGKWLDEKYRKEFANLVVKNNFSSNINIVGEVSEKELRKYYSQALVLLQTNDDRGFGMPALEAAGNGTTFIIPKGQGVCNLFKNKIDGFYTKERDIKVIVDYLNKLTNNKNQAVKMGRHAWETVKNKYTWQKHGKKLVRISKIYAE